MDLSFHSHQFGKRAADASADSRSRLSHARLMAMVNGETSLSTLRHWRTRWLIDNARPDGMAARRRFFARPAVRDAGVFARGAFCPPLTATGERGAAASEPRKGKFGVYQGSSVLGKITPLQVSTGNDAPRKPDVQARNNAYPADNSTVS